MASPASSFAAGLERGWRMGDSAEQAKFRREDRERDQKDRDREDRINAIVGQAFSEPAAAPAAGAQPVAMPQPKALGAVPGATPAPMPQPAGLEAVPGAKPVAMPGAPGGAAPQQRSSDLVGQLNGTLNRLFKAAADPANADIAPYLFDKANVIAGSSKRFGDVMLNQARQKAMPHIKVLYSPGASDEQKTAAVGALMNEVFPDGDDYFPQVVGKEVRLLDSTGKPVMGADGKPRTLSMDDLDQMLTYGLSTPDDYISSVQESIKARREQELERLKIKDQRDWEVRRDKEKYAQRRSDELADQSRREGLEISKEERAAARALEKERRDEKRDTKKDRRKFIANTMAAYDKDVAHSASDPEARKAYLKQVRAIADEQFGGGNKDPAPVEMKPGDTIEVDIGPGLETPTRAAPAVQASPATQVPLPEVAATPSGPSGATYNPKYGRGVQEIAAGLDALGDWKERQRTSGFRSMADKFRQGVSAGKVDPVLVQRLRTVPDRVLQRDYGLSPKEIAAIKQGGG